MAIVKMSDIQKNRQSTTPESSIVPMSQIVTKNSSSITPMSKIVADRAKASAISPDDIAKYGLTLHPESSEIMQKAHQFVDNQPKTNVLDKILKDNPVMRVINYPFAKAAEYSVPDANYLGTEVNAREDFAARNPVLSTGNKTVDKVGDFAGHIGSMFTPVGTGGAFVNDIGKGTSALLASKVGQKFGLQAGKAGAKIANVANPTLNQLGINVSTDLAQKAGQAALRGGSLGAGFGALEPLRTGSGELSEVPKSVVENTAMFAAGDAMLPFAGAGLKVAGEKLIGTKLGEALSSFIGKAKKEIKQPVTFPNPTRLKVAGTEDSFNAIIPKVFEKATERMTPPLENQNELAKWVRNHLNNYGHDVSLNEVRKLSYEDLRGFAEEMRTKIDIPDLVRTTAHDMGYGNIYEGIPAPIKEKMAYDAQSRVYGVPAPNVNIKKLGFNPRTLEKPPERIVNAPLPEKPFRDPNEPFTPEAKVPKIGYNPNVNSVLPDKPFRDPNEPLNPTAKSSQVTSPAGVRTDGLTIMEKYFPDGRVDPKILEKLPYEERLRFQEEQAPGYKKPVTMDSRGLPSDASHLKNTPPSLREEISRNNALAEKLRVADQIEELFSQGLTSKEVRQKLTYKLPSDYNEAKSVVESVRSFRGIPSSSDKPEFEAWLKGRGSTPQIPKNQNDTAELNAIDRNPQKHSGDESDIITAEPRISSKVSGYLEDEIKAASDRIKEKNYVGNPNTKVADHALIGVGYIERGTRRLADFTEQMVREFGEEVRPQIREIFKQSKQIFKDTEARVSKDLQGLAGIEPAFLKDSGMFSHNTSDIYRIFKNVFKDKFAQVKKSILDPLDAAKLENVKMQEFWLDKIHNEVVDKLGIDKGSKLSALVQRFGEKGIDLIDLQKLAPNDWEKVVEADKFFRSAYDTIVDQVNATRKQIYPNNPDKLVPKREDYYRHFQEFSGLTGLKNLFDTPAGIDPHLVGISENTLPKSRFAGFMQKRGLGKFKNDAVGGFLEYIPGASYATHIDPQIGVFKNLKNNIASETEKTKQMDHFLLFLDRYAQDLAGKTNNFDRVFQENIPGGRKSFKVLNWTNSRVKSNTILANAASAIAQVGNVPAGAAFAKQYAIKGAGKTLLTAFKGNPLHEESQFLKERFVDKNYRKFDTRWLDIKNPLKLKNAAIWALETADRMGTEFTWNSIYEKGVKEGVKNPIKYADDETRRIVGGRGIGEVPLLQKSKVFQTIAPFTLEVANAWRVQKDFVKSKDFGGLALLMLGSYAFNKVAEEVKGSGVLFDPIQAMIEAAGYDFDLFHLKLKKKEESLTPLERVGRLAGEVISNVPMGGTLASLYPENGGDVFGHKVPTRKELFGDNDPTRFGTGLIAAKGLSDPLFKLLPSFGGNQIKKTIEGINSIVHKGSYNDGKLKTPIEMNPLKAAQSVTFGPNSTKEMQTYFDEERRPLSEKQTKFYESLPDKDKAAYYKELMKQRKIDSLQEAYKKAIGNADSTDAQKQKQVDELTRKFNEVMQAK